MLAANEKTGADQGLRPVTGKEKRVEQKKNGKKAYRFVLEYSCIKKKTIFARNEAEAMKMFTMNLEDETVTEIIAVQSFED